MKQQALALSVSELNRIARNLLEESIGEVQVEGEISNFTRPSSGHWYLTLKDSAAQIRCAMFRNRNLSVQFKPGNGDLVSARGRLSIYEARGDYQLILESLSPAGSGALLKQFEALKQKLQQEGVFDAQYKRPLPAYARKIAVISSATGAAIRDIVQVLSRRDPGIEIIVVPSAVQGDAAAGQLLAALARCQKYLPDIDALIIARGGGSLEDLWPFNDESLARAVFAYNKPVISAIGHEIDFSILDFVADVRAPTPSAAAELISSDRSELIKMLALTEQRLKHNMSRRLSAATQQLAQHSRNLKHPGAQIEQWQQRIDICEQRLQQRLQHTLEKAQILAANVQRRLQHCTPGARIAQQRESVHAARKQLTTLIKHRLSAERTRLKHVLTALDQLSPLASLRRGYSILSNERGDIVRSSAELTCGEAVRIQLAEGALNAKITALDHRARIPELAVGQTQGKTSTE